MAEHAYRDIHEGIEFLADLNTKFFMQVATVDLLDVNVVGITQNVTKTGL